MLYDAVAILASDAGGAQLAKTRAARDFVSDACAHCKFIGYTAGAAPLLDKAGVADMLDDGWVALRVAADASTFIAKCAELRLWTRELQLDSMLKTASP